MICMGFEVETLKFEGPLDLMLHLIHEQQLDIFDLDMAVLTEQYIEYLHAMEELHLEVESEYLVEQGLPRLFINQLVAEHAAIFVGSSRDRIGIEHLSLDLRAAMTVVPDLGILGRDGVKAVRHTHNTSLNRGCVNIYLAIVSCEYLRIAGNGSLHNVAMLPTTPWKKHSKIAISVSGYLTHILKQGFTSLSQGSSPTSSLEYLQRLGVGVTGD